MTYLKQKEFLEIYFSGLSITNGFFKMLILVSEELYQNHSPPKQTIGKKYLLLRKGSILMFFFEFGLRR